MQIERTMALGGLYTAYCKSFSLQAHIVKIFYN